MHIALDPAQHNAVRTLAAVSASALTSDVAATAGEGRLREASRSATRVPDEVLESAEYNPGL